MVWHGELGKVERIAFMILGASNWCLASALLCIVLHGLLVEKNWSRQEAALI